MFIDCFASSVVYYSFAFLTADLGGILGLFLGGSAMSVCEIIDLFVYNLAVQLKYSLSRKILNRNKKELTDTLANNSKQNVNTDNNFNSNRTPNTDFNLPSFADSNKSYQYSNAAFNEITAINI